MHRDETDTIFAWPDRHVMVHGVVAQIEITWAIISRFMAETPRQDTGHLRSGMSVFQHFCSGSGFQQEYPRVAPGGEANWAQPYAGCDPLPGSGRIPAHESR